MTEQNTRGNAWLMKKLVGTATLLSGASSYAIACGVIAAAVSMPHAAQAQTTPHGGWCAAYYTGNYYPNGYIGTLPAKTHNVPYSSTICKYDTPAAACAQMVSPDGGYVEAVYPTQQWWVWGCNTYDIWSDGSTGGGSGGIFFTCETGYAVSPGRCVSLPINSSIPINANGGPASCSQPTGGETPHPIDIMSGSKVYRRTDYENTAGTLKLNRIYSSMGTGGISFGTVGDILGAGNWAFDFEYEVQFGDHTGMPGVTDATPVVALVTPSKSVYQFVKQTDGTLAPYATGVNPQTQYTLKLLTSWPASTTDISAVSSTWEMTDPEGSVWTFESVDPTPAGSTSTFNSKRAHVTKVVKRNGVEIDFAYNSSHALTSITDNFGNQITFNADQLDIYGEYVIRKATFSDGTAVAYNYLSGGLAADRLGSVQYLDASNAVVDSETYNYGNTGFLNGITSIVDKNGVTRWSATYDVEGRALTSSGGGGAETYSVSYAASGATFSRTVTNPLGKQSTYNYATTTSSTYDPKLTGTTGVASTNCPSSATSIAYGTNSLVSSAVDEEGRSTTYQWDARGLQTQIVEASGTSAQRTTTATWSSTQREPLTITASGATVSFTYDTLGRILTKTITDTTSQTVPYSTNGQSRTWTYTWGTAGGAIGEIVAVDGPLSGTGDTQYFTYNSNGYLASTTNEVGLTTTITAWDKSGLPLTIVDPNSVSTTLTYDSHGRPLTATINPGSSQKSYAFSYDAAGNLSQMTLPTGGYLTYTYDTASHLTQIANDKGETITYTPNNLGDATSMTVKTSGAAITAQQSYVYDELGRLISSVGGASSTATRFGYDKVDNRTSMTDGRSKVWSNSFDALNRVTTATNPESQSVKYGYNTQDIVIDHKDGRNIETTFVTDGFGEVIQEVSLDRGTRTYWYDLAGRMTKLVDGDSEETDFTYDNSGRLLTRIFPGASWEAMAYTYDGVSGGNVGKGRLTRVTEQSGASALTYDAFGRIVSDSKTIQGLTYAVGYTYDKNDNVTQVTLPSGRIVTFTRDADSQITAIATQPSASGTSVSVASSVTYRPFGPMTGLTYGNGLTLTRTYNLNNWLTRVQVKNGTSALLDLGYDYYDDGRLGEIDDNAATGRIVYMALSDSGRLTYAGGPWGQESYSWDAAGNRIGDYLTVGGTTTSDNEITSGSTNRLVKTVDGAGTTKRTLMYRAGGDLYSDLAASSSIAYTYSYSARKRLVAIQLAGVTAAQYGYDFRDQRVWRTVTGAVSHPTIHYIFDEDGHLLAEHDGGTGAVIREYVWLDDMPIAVIDSSSGTATTYYIHTGHLDEPLEMTNAAKTKVWDAYMTPFGNAKVFSTASASIDIRLPGQWFQTEAAGSGLNQNGYRDYDPSLGRYIEADPTGLNGGQNPYAYADGKVYDLRDRFGLDVNLVFNRSLSTLTAVDQQTGKSLTVHNVVSGNGDFTNNPAFQGLPGYGPLPGGQYLVGPGFAEPNHPGNNWWYHLYGSGGSGGYSYTCIPVQNPKSGQTVCRGYFNLHTGRESDGCVTIYSEVARGEPNYPQNHEYDALRSMLDKTKPFIYKGQKFVGHLNVK